MGAQYDNPDHRRDVGSGLITDARTAIQDVGQWRNA